MLTATYAGSHIKAPYAECRYAECRYAECRGALSCPVSQFVHGPYFPPFFRLQL
jgi:hypothetical protein